jgi:AraC-like DNA-binding protein
MNGVNTINYSNIFVSCFSDNATLHASMAKENYLVYVFSGELIITEQDRTSYIGKNECAFIRKDVRIKMVKHAKDGKQYKCIVLNFTRRFLRGFYHTALDKSKLPADARRHKFSLYKLPACRPDITSLFLSLTPFFDTSIPPDDELINSKLIEGVRVLLNTDTCFYSALFDFSEPWKTDILDYLNENYMYDLSPADMANFTGRSLTAFKRDFKKLSNLSPQKWIIQKRLEVAQLKIKNENRKVSEVCFEVGFKNLSHFSRAYKEAFGTAPSK